MKRSSFIKSLIGAIASIPLFSAKKADKPKEWHIRESIDITDYNEFQIIEVERQAKQRLLQSVLEQTKIWETGGTDGRIVKHFYIKVYPKNE